VPPLPPFDLAATLDVDTLVTGGSQLASVSLRVTAAPGSAQVRSTIARGDFGGIAVHQANADVDIADGALTGGFRAARVDADRVPLTNVNGRIALGEDRVLHVTDVSADAWTGRLEGAARVDLADPVDPHFTIDTRARGLQANDFLTALTPAHGLLFGTLDLESSFTGHGTDPQAIAAALTGGGNVTGSSGHFAKSPPVSSLWESLNLGERETIAFNDFVTSFSVEDGKLFTRDLALGGRDADWKVAGFVGFDGRLDYDVQVALGEALSDTYRKRLGGELAKLLANDTGRLTLDLKITGEARQPSVRVDTARLFDRARKNAADAVKDQLKTGLQNLLGKPDAAGDSAAADTTTEKPLEKALKGLFGGK
jgi:hypothetical protein